MRHRSRPYELGRDDGSQHPTIADSPQVQQQGADFGVVHSVDHGAPYP